MNEFSDFIRSAALSIEFNKIPKNEGVRVSAWFFLRRPDEDFVNRQRLPGKLKSSSLEARRTTVAIKPDVDNLAKFLLDAMTGVLFEDDSQIVELNVHKLRDNVGTCDGRVAIQVERASNITNMPNF